MTAGGAWAELAVGRRCGEVGAPMVCSQRFSRERWPKGFVVSHLPASAHFLSRPSSLLALQEPVHPLASCLCSAGGQSPGLVPGRDVGISDWFLLLRFRCNREVKASSCLLPQIRGQRAGTEHFWGWLPRGEESQGMECASSQDTRIGRGSG